MDPEEDEHDHSESSSDLNEKKSKVVVSGVTQEILTEQLQASEEKVLARLSDFVTVERFNEFRNSCEEQWKE